MNPMRPPEPRPDETLDDLLHGEMKILQRRSGYRYSVDALLLAAFALPLAASARVLDLGAGSGVVALILARRGRPARVVGIELQPGLADLARRNARLNATDPPVEIVEADALAAAPTLVGFDLVVTNPPFRAEGSGIPSPLPEKALARHELAMSLPQWLRTARDALAPGGSVCIVYPVDQEERLHAAAAAAGLFPVRRQYALDRPGGRRRLLLLELRAQPAPLLDLPAVAIETDQGKFSLDGYR
jgi:tRNA1Val (adenine37-N6)-methyltransferase